jgi:EmrB/QacA subfamily drug resistance transporter
VATAPVPAALDQVRRYLPWTVAVALFMQQLDATIVNTAVPTMAASFKVASLSLKSVVTSYTIGLAVFIPLSGWVADRFGTRRVFGVAVFLFTLGSLCCGLSLNLPMLIASRVLQGAGAAIILPVGRLSLLQTFPKSEMLRVMNFVIIPALLGPLLGPFMGGVIVHLMPWRMIFFINLPVGILGMWLVHRYMPNHRVSVPRTFDGWGFVLFAGGVALFSYVLEIFGEHRLSRLDCAALILVSFVLLLGYGFHARRHAHPLLPLEIFRLRTFRVSVLGGFVTRLGISGMPFLLPLLYQVGLGYPAWQAGLLTMPQALAAIGMKLLTPRIYSTWGYRAVLLVNTALIGLTIMIFSFVGPHTPVWMILVFSFLQGSFSALQFTGMNSLAYADTSGDQASDATTIAGTAQQMSISFGVAVASLVTGWFLAGINHGESAALVAALHHAFITLGIMTILSTLTFISLRADDGSKMSNQHVAREAG